MQYKSKTQHPEISPREVPVMNRGERSGKARSMSAGPVNSHADSRLSRPEEKSPSSSSSGFSFDPAPIELVAHGDETHRRDQGEYVEPLDCFQS